MNPIWSPSPEFVLQSRIEQLRKRISAENSINLNDYSELHKFSIENQETFAFAKMVVQTEPGRKVLKND